MPTASNLSAPCPPAQRSLLCRLLLYPLACYAAVVLILMALEDRLLFHPKTAAQQWIDLPGRLRSSDVSFWIAGGLRAHGRWYPCPGARGAVLICHSRSGNLSVALPPAAVAEWHREVGESLLIFDYPGYGRSEGSPSEAGCCAVADAAYEWLVRDRTVPAERVLLVGRSLGTGVAVDLAARRPHRALVLISPFTSIPDVAQSRFPLLPARWLAHNRFDSRARIGGCARPLLIVHGTDDRTVPFAQGEELFAAANEPKRFLPVVGAGHGDAVLAGFFPALRQFLQDVEGCGPADVRCD